VILSRASRSGSVGTKWTYCVCISSGCRKGSNCLGRFVSSAMKKQEDRVLGMRYLFRNLFWKDTTVLFLGLASSQ
jgi:hypothetical protein